MKNQVPSYLNTKQNLTLLVLATALFAELFILFFQPFESRGWVSTDWQFILWSTIIVLVAMGIIALSRTLMCNYAKRHEISYLDYAIWIAAELIAMATIYAAFPIVVLQEFSTERGLSFFYLFKESLLAATFILLIPYTIITLWIALKEKTALVHDSTSTPTASPMYLFYDEKGDLKLSAKSEMVYLLEAADNYVTIYYLYNEKVEKMMIRNSLRNIECRFSDQGLVRCHRSYVINIHNVQVVRCQDGEVLVDFGDKRFPTVPVSKGYAEKVMASITHYK